MKKVYILINHFQVQDGIARAAISVANELAKRPDVSVTLRSLFRFDPQMKKLLSPRVKAKPFLGFYFRGLAKLVGLIPKRWLYRLLVREKYDIEIGFCMTLPTQIVAASTNAQAKHYAWMHGYDDGLTLLDSYRRMDKVMTVSRCNEERFRCETNGQISAQCCHNLADDEKIRAMGGEAVEVPEGRGLTFIAVGRLEPGKGILRLIECCGRLKREGYAFALWLVGDGAQRRELEKRAAELGLREEVVFFGAQRNPYAYTSRADVLVCASYSEGYSTSCVEAILLDVSVLSTNVSGAEEIVSDAKAGMVVGMEDEALYRGMKAILDDPSLVEKWKETLLTTREVFSYQNRAAELMRALEIDQ